MHAWILLDACSFLPRRIRPYGSIVALTRRNCAGACPGNSCWIAGRRLGTITECPISTADGVKAADAAWASAERWLEMGNRVCFVRSPEICVEVLSPSNIEEEINEKTFLYLDAGAQEVWVCDSFEGMSFFGPGPAPLPASGLCPAFPPQVEPR